MGLTQSEQKTLVANTAIDTLIEKGLIFSGMKIGLGTGSTAMPAVKRLAEHINSGKLKDVKAVVDDQTNYIDWNKKADIKAQLKVKIILTLAKYKYPPKTPSEDAYKAIFEQAENFKFNKGQKAAKEQQIYFTNIHIDHYNDTSRHIHLTE